MRLTDQQQVIIKTVILKHFGERSEVRLFGSRANDQGRGGDIDIYIEPEFCSAEEVVEAKLNALVDLRLALGDQKIDLVINRKAGAVLPIYQIAKENGICL